jgi:hypothetical protein
MSHRLVFTNKANSYLDIKYVSGSGVGAKSISNRRALLIRSNNTAEGVPCMGYCIKKYIPPINIIPSKNIICGFYYTGNLNDRTLTPEGFIWYPTDTTPKSFPPPSALNAKFKYYIPQSASRDENTIIGVCSNEKIKFYMGFTINGYIFNYTVSTNIFSYYTPPSSINELCINLTYPQIISQDGSTIFGLICGNTNNNNFKLNSDFKSELIFLNISTSPYNISNSYTSGVSNDGTISVGFVNDDDNDNDKGYMLNGTTVTYPVSFTDVSGSFITSITSDGKTYVGVCLDYNEKYLFAFKNDTKLSITNVSKTIGFNILISPDGSTVVWFDGTDLFKQINGNSPIKIDIKSLNINEFSILTISEDGTIISGLFILGTETTSSIASFRIIGNKIDIIDKPSFIQGSS